MIKSDHASYVPQDTLEYKKKQRPLKIRMLDGTVKTVMVDDSKIVSDMLMTICARIGELYHHTHLIHLADFFFSLWLTAKSVQSRDYRA